MMMQDFWILLVVILLSLSASLLGCFLMLRKMSMLTDAIAHSILPGIVVAYLLAGKKDNFLILTIASGFGVLTAWLAAWIERKVKNRADAATGISFTFLFAVGIILATLFAEQADLDADCVLFGEMLYIPFETFKLGMYEFPRTFPLALVVFGGVTVFILVSYRKMSIISFDETFAFSIGISVTAWHYSLISMVSVVTVSSFEVLGSVLVIALFVFPPATAYLLTKNLKPMIALSFIISIFTVIIGYYLSVWQGGSSAASIVLVQGFTFSVSLVYHKRFSKSTVAPIS
jgi:manganese/zinc/iron transport system permease protein